MKSAQRSCVDVPAGSRCRRRRGRMRRVDAEVAAAPVLDDRYPKAKVIVWLGRGELSRSRVFSTLPGFRPLRLDLYRPGERAGPTAAGGLRPWRRLAERSHAPCRRVRKLARRARVAGRRGYVVASIEYRLEQRGEVSCRDPGREEGDSVVARQRGEVLRSIRSRSWCGADRPAASWPRWLRRPAVSIARAGRACRRCVESQSDCVQGLVAWYGVFDLRRLRRRDPAANPPQSCRRKYLGCAPAQCADKRRSQARSRISMRRIRRRCSIHGELDKVVPVGQSRAFDSALSAKGVASELIVIPGVDHSFIGDSPEATRKASLQALTQDI